MSILIKGMKMPTSCLKGGCPLDGFACQLWEDKYWSRVESPEKMRHKNCPLIELPDHGDLIDRDAMRITVGRTNGKMLFAELLKKVPAVIPAERSEDGET